MFWTNVNSIADKLEKGPPELPRKRWPAFFGNAAPEFPTEVKSHYTQIYFEAFDTVTGCLEKPFLQGDYVNHYQLLESFYSKL